MILFRQIDSRNAAALVVQHHYMHRRPPISVAFGLYVDNEPKGVVTFGVPGSHHMLLSACEKPQDVIELNRLWVADDMPPNTESYFLSQALKKMPPKIVLSYADTAAGHVGYVYRAANFYYAGWTDMERKTPRFDYITPGKHSRDAFRDGAGVESEKVRRKPKIRYWTVTGNRKQKRDLEARCLWPKLSWKEFPPPTEHKQFNLASRKA